MNDAAMIMSPLKLYIIGINLGVTKHSLCSFSTALVLNQFALQTCNCVNWHS